MRCFHRRPGDTWLRTHTPPVAWTGSAAAWSGVQPHAQPWAGCPPPGRGTWARRLCRWSPAARRALFHHRVRAHGAVIPDWHGTCMPLGWTRRAGHAAEHGHHTPVETRGPPDPPVGRRPPGPWRQPRRARPRGTGGNTARRHGPAPARGRAQPGHQGHAWQRCWLERRTRGLSRCPMPIGTCAGGKRSRPWKSWACARRLPPLQGAHRLVALRRTHQGDGRRQYV